jgi:hypothetical protein
LASDIGGGDVLKATKLCVAAAVIVLAVGGPAFAQGDPNPGAITFTGGLDVPSIYFFRGIRQEVDPGLTLWPYGDIGLALASGDGTVKSVGVNLGVWNSLHTGSSGSDGPGRIHYEEDFYATLGLGFGGGVTVGTTYMALTSPNNLFNTVQELQFRVTKAHMLAPYGFLAFELSDEGQADLGTKKGTYLELGVGPSWPIPGGMATVTVPVKLGLGLNNYYEGPTGDTTFGFLDIGGLATIPLTGVPSQFGSWNIHGGVDVLFFGDTTEAFNIDSDGETSGNKIVALVGIGVTY